MRDRVVLVTGATGFVGRALCAALDAEGARVHAISRSGETPEGAAHAHALDATSAPEVATLLRAVRPSRVYHLAAHVTGSRDPEVVLPTLHGKLVSTVNVLAAAREQGDCRVVLAGSLEEPDPGDDPAPTSPYAAASWGASVYGAMFHALYGLPVVTARIFMAYGPGDPNGERLVPYVTRSLLRGEAPKLASGVRPVDWIYVEDLARGLVALGADEGVVGGSVDLGSGELVTVREVALMIRDLIGAEVEPAFGALPDRPGERVRAADLEATRARLDWSPSTPLREGLARTVESHRAKGR